MEQEDQAQELEGTAADGAQDQGAETGTEEKDWKSLYEGAIKESRKWEKRSKSSRAEIESLKAASPKPDPTLEERLAALEEENNSLKAAKARNALIDSGIIPAYAGNTNRSVALVGWHRDHPRVCGEHLSWTQRLSWLAGSSPRCGEHRVQGRWFPWAVEALAAHRAGTAFLTARGPSPSQRVSADVKARPPITRTSTGCS